jgi:hypothetical protein
MQMGTKSLLSGQPYHFKFLYLQTLTIVFHFGRKKRKGRKRGRNTSYKKKKSVLLFQTFSRGATLAVVCIVRVVWCGVVWFGLVWCSVL